MPMPPGLRKFVLTAHITTTVGWLGALACFFALSVVGLTSQESRMVRAVYLAAEPLTWFVLLPLAGASLLTGIVQSLGSRWGLFRHYWILFKLLITVLAALVLLQYTQTVSQVATAAAVPGGDPAGLRNAGFVLHSGAGLLALLAAVALTVYKPRGMTPYGRGKQQRQRNAPAPQPLPERGTHR